MLSQGLFFLRTWEEGACWCLILVLPAGRCHVCAHPCCPQASLGPGDLESVWSCPLPANGHSVPVLGLQRYSSASSCEQSKETALVQLLKQIWVLCHLFCRDTKPSELFGKGREYFQDLWKRWMWKLRIGRSLDNTKTDQIQQNKHLREQTQERKLTSTAEKHNIDWIFHLVSSPLPFIREVIFSQWFYSAQQILRVFHSSEMLWQCRRPQHVTLPCQQGGLVSPGWWEAPGSSGWHWLPQPSPGPPLPAARSHSCDPKHSCVSFFRGQEGELQTVWKMIKSGKLFKTTLIVLWNSCFHRVQMNPMTV